MWVTLMTISIKISDLSDLIFDSLQYVTNNGSKFIFRTNRNAPNYRLISVDLNDPAEKKWTTLLAEDEKDVLESVQCVDENKLIIVYMRDVKVLHFGENDLIFI